MLRTGREHCENAWKSRKRPEIQDLRRSAGSPPRHDLAPMRPRAGAFWISRPLEEWIWRMNAPAPKVSFVSLGCPKALVDSERIITQLRAQGYQLTKEHDGADVVIVNTCGFLDSAKAESLDAIGQAMAANGKGIVTGCLGAGPGRID